MKKISCFIVCLSILLCGCTSTRTENYELEEMHIKNDEVIKAVWVNYNELSMKNSENKSEDSFRKRAEDIMKGCSQFGLNRVIVQVRPFCDAFYNSELFPATEYLSGVQGEYIGYDALKILSEYAHKYSIKIDAWINPFRVSYKTDISSLSEDSIAVRWYKNSETNRNVIIIDGGIFLNPTKDDVHRLIVDGVREILDNYDVDGIHIDDYFYPTTDEGFDMPEYEAYMQDGGRLSHSEWRREHINSLVSDIYTVVKQKDESLIFSVSPSGDIRKNYDCHFADIKKWCENEGYIDVIIPQLYYGFENEAKPFESVFDEWMSIELADSVKMCVGLPVYKYGKEDKFAGTGIREWIDNNDIISRQISYVKSRNSECGIVLYSYSYILGEEFAKNYKNELQKIKNVLQYQEK